MHGITGCSVLPCRRIGLSEGQVVGPLIHERDVYLAWSLKRSKAVNGCKRVVGVMVRAHNFGSSKFCAKYSSG